MGSRAYAHCTAYRGLANLNCKQRKFLRKTVIPLVSTTKQGRSTSRGSVNGDHILKLNEVLSRHCICHYTINRKRGP